MFNITQIANKILTTKNRSAIETTLIWENTPLLAGQALGYAIEGFDAKSMNLAVSVNDITGFRLEVEQRPPIGSIPVGNVTVIVESTTKNGIGKFDLVSNRMLIRITNTGTVDTTIKGLLLTKVY